jgi:hypothetical protein
VLVVFIGIWGGSETPRYRPPAYRAHPTPCGAGEQIPRASAIMLPISGNVHGATLKQSELI